MEDEKLKFCYMETDKIKGKAYNPPSRTEPRALSVLLESIRQYGILNPLTIGQDGILADGHRRLECAKRLGIEKVPCVITWVSSDISYNEQNTSPRRLTPNEALYVLLSGGKSNPRTAAQFERYSKLLGVSIMEKLCDMGLSLGGLKTNEASIKAVLGDDVNDAMLKKALVWIAENGQSYKMRRWASDGGSKEIALACINNNISLPIA